MRDGAMVAVTAVLLVACANPGAPDGGTTYACVQGPVTMPAQCREVIGGNRSLVIQECTNVASGNDGGVITTATYLDAPCPRANIVGGCRRSLNGAVETNWYYAPAFPGGALEALCPDGTIVQP